MASGKFLVAMLACSIPVVDCFFEHLPVDVSSRRAPNIVARVLDLSIAQIHHLVWPLEILHDYRLYFRSALELEDDDSGKARWSYHAGLVVRLNQD